MQAAEIAPKAAPRSVPAMPLKEVAVPFVCVTAFWFCTLEGARKGEVSIYRAPVWLRTPEKKLEQFI
jgi:hypothetical protein